MAQSRRTKRLPDGINEWADEIETVATLGPAVAVVLRGIALKPQNYAPLTVQVVRAVFEDNDRATLLYALPDPRPAPLDQDPLLQDLVEYIQTKRAERALRVWRKAGIPAELLTDYRLAECYDNLVAIYRQSESQQWPTVSPDLIIQAVAHNPYWLAQGYRFTLRQPSVNIAPLQANAFYAKLVATAKAMQIDTPDRADEAAIVLAMFDHLRRGQSRVVARYPDARQRLNYGPLLTKTLPKFYRNAGRPYDPDAAYDTMLRLTQCPRPEDSDEPIDDQSSPWTLDNFTWARLFQLTYWPRPEDRHQLQALSVPLERHQYFSFYLLFWSEHHTIQMLEAFWNRPRIPLPDGWDTAVAALRYHGNPLSPTQTLALTQLWQQPFSLLMGAAGTGKTTLVALFQTLLQQFHPEALLVSGAPTGKAAQRLTQSLRTLHPEAVDTRTIHRLTHIYSEFGHTPPQWLGQQLPDDSAVVIDESSMLDIFLLHATLNSLATWAPASDAPDAKRIPTMAPVRILFVLDDIQTPPIGPSGIVDLVAALAKLFDREAYQLRTPAYDPRIRLTDNFRQAEAPALQDLLDQVRTLATAPPRRKPTLRWIPSTAYQHNHMVFADSEEAIHRQWARELAAFWTPAHRDLLMEQPSEGFAQFPDRVLLTPTRHLSYFLSAIIRESLGWTNPFHSFEVGELIINKVNDYTTRIMNGTLGRVIAIALDPRTQQTTQVTAQFAQYTGSQPIWSPPWTLSIQEAIHRWRWAYALTIHESQGSEWSDVHVVLPSRALWTTMQPFWQARYQTPWTQPQSTIDTEMLEPWETDASSSPEPQDTVYDLLGVHDLRLPYTGFSRAKVRLGTLSDYPLSQLLRALETLPARPPQSRLFAVTYYRFKDRADPPDATW